MKPLKIKSNHAEFELLRAVTINNCISWSIIKFISVKSYVSGKKYPSYLSPA
jgi:hypothetical protein